MATDTVLDSITVDLAGIVSVRRVTYTLDGGGERLPNPTVQRNTYEPGADLTGEDPTVQARAAAAWTPAILAAQGARVAAVTAAHTFSPAQLALQQQQGVDAMPIVWRAIVLALIDQLNVLRAALPVPLAAITPAQAIAAIRAKAGTL